MEDEPNLTDSERKFFEVVGPRLERFASDHNLKLEKWFKDVGMWAFEFRKPRRGAVHIIVSPRGDGRAELTSAWWVDDYDSETRRLASNDPYAVSTQEPLLERALLDEIRRVLDWSNSQLTDHDLPNGSWHDWFSREVFERLDESLPLPRL